VRHATVRATLEWIERGLIVLGVVLGTWSVIVLLEANFFRQLPVPPPAPRQVAATTGTLPGDGGTAEPSRPRSITPGSWLARLEAPSVQLTATVLEGSDDSTLAKGAGHIEDTPPPGAEGNIGIAGHRDTTFRAVRRLKVGDPLVLETRDKVQRFKIVWMKVVEPDDVYVLDPTPKPALTLVTCYPFEFIGHAPHRYIVRAALVGEEPRKTE
jgi:LPXTG-site transpeptidase (sortase) family protein